MFFLRKADHRLTTDRQETAKLKLSGFTVSYTKFLPVHLQYINLFLHLTHSLQLGGLLAEIYNLCSTIYDSFIDSLR